MFVANKKRFFKEYGLAQEDEPKKGKKPGRIGFSDESHNLMKYFIIPPVYEVYRGYIVFAFFVCVCVFVNFFSVKDFSGTT